MKSSLTKFALSAGIMLAMALTISCSGDDGDEGGGGGSSGSGGGSSSPSGSSPSGGTSGTFKDTRDGTTYKTTKIGNQTWLAENLNYDVPNNDTDICYDNEPDKCKTYGRLYNWETAKTACPNGWRLSSGEDWDILITAVGGEDTADKHLKAKSGWNNYASGGELKSSNGTDDYGFSALPGGLSYPDGVGNNVGYDGFWWTANEDNSNLAYSRYIHYKDEDEYVKYDASNKSMLYSVRCIQD